MKDSTHIKIQIRKNNHSILKILFFTVKNNYKIVLILLFYLFNYIGFLLKKYFSLPKISIFLPIYNKAKYLNRSISSIQMQTLKDIEIIPVNDCSEDNSLDILKKMAKKDSRIKIINNQKNRGLLYSRAMGIINSKGEYLMNLDPDDELEGPDNLEFLYYKAHQTKVDIISFGIIQKKNEYNYTNGSNQPINLIKCNNYDKVIFQPNILNYGNQLDDFLITNKLIKRNLLLKAYKIFKNKIYQGKWNYGEDEIWSFLVNKYAHSMICVKKGIFIYYLNNDSLMNHRFNSLYFLNIIDYIEILIKILNNRMKRIYITTWINQISIITYNNSSFK